MKKYHCIITDFEEDGFDIRENSGLIQSLENCGAKHVIFLGEISNEKCVKIGEILKHKK